MYLKYADNKNMSISLIRPLSMCRQKFLYLLYGHENEAYNNMKNV